MTIQLRTDAGKRLYEQIYEHIRQEIREGKLLAGERLPSTRYLAEYLQVSRSTVDCAYDQLLSEGYIEARPYRGYFVCSLEDMLDIRMEESGSVPASPRQGDEEGALREEGKAQENCSRDAEEGLWQSVCGRKGRADCLYDFSPNGIDMSAFPFGVWKRITRDILNDANGELLSQGEPQGDYDLRLTISRYLHSSRGVNCSPEQILVGAGNDYLLMLLEKLLGKGKRIVMENPTYKRAYRIFHSFDYEIVTVDTDAGGMLVSGLQETRADAVYVMPSHQFPTGAVMPIGRRTELLRWANQVPDRYVIEDDYDSEFRYRGKPIPSLQASDQGGRVIYIGTFSKAIAPAIRVSYMVLPQELLERYLRCCFFYSCTVSRIDQRILNEFIGRGYFERHLNKMRKRYHAKHDLLLECLKPFETAFSLSGEDAGLHILLRARGNATEEELLGAAAKRGVKVYGLSESLVKTPGSEHGTVLLGFGALNEREIEAGAALLQEAWL